MAEHITNPAGKVTKSTLPPGLRKVPIRNSQADKRIVTKRTDTKEVPRTLGMTNPLPFAQKPE